TTADLAATGGDPAVDAAATAAVEAASQAAGEAPAVTPEPPAPTPEPPTPTPEPPTPTPAIFAVTSNTQANLRASPDLNAQIVGGTQPGQAINVVGRTADGQWYRLDTGSWIFAQLINGAPADAPVVDPNAPAAIA